MLTNTRFRDTTYTLRKQHNRDLVEMNPISWQRRAARRPKFFVVINMHKKSIRNVFLFCCRTAMNWRAHTSMTRIQRGRDTHTNHKTLQLHVTPAASPCTTDETTAGKYKSANSCQKRSPSLRAFHSIGQTVWVWRRRNATSGTEEGMWFRVIISREWCGTDCVLCPRLTAYSSISQIFATWRGVP
jgi:hypothetical protein